jgi:hypothetical protein
LNDEGVKLAKIVFWTPEVAQKELKKRLAYAKEARKNVELEWKDSERILFGDTNPDVSVSVQSRAELDPLTWEATRSRKSLSINTAFKNHRFLHSQLAANPPSVLPRAASNDPSDRTKADAADRLIRHALRKYQVQEHVDQSSSNCLLYGTASIKTIWDAEDGDILEVKEDGTVLMEGEIKFSVPSIWHLFPDPDANFDFEIKWVFELIYMPYEEACYRFPDKKDLLKQYRIQEREVEEDSNSHTHTVGPKYDVVPIYQYWEKGLVYNGLIGRFCYCTENGELLTPVGPNPFRFSRPKDRGLSIPAVPDEESNQKMPERAELPYHWFTDIDVPGRLWGRSTMYYQGPLQDLHNQMVNVMVDVLEAHGVPRLILPDGTEISDESITNTPWDIIKVNNEGGKDPQFMAPMPMPQAFGDLLQLISGGIDAMAGVNDSMFGVQQREQSGFSMQYATNQGNMIRRRLFNKYVKLVENVYKAYLNLVRKHWTTSRSILVLGKEKRFEAKSIKGTDIDGGFDIVVEYGASLSLDPTSRREEILTLSPLFEKAGVQPNTLLGLMKLNDLDSLYDRTQLARDRQNEIFQEMIEKNLYIPPREMQDHQGMLAFSYEFLMTSEFKYLLPEQQTLIEQHIKEREQMAAAAQATMPGPGGMGSPAVPEGQLAGPGPAGSPPPPPVGPIVNNA